MLNNHWLLLGVTSTTLPITGFQRYPKIQVRFVCGAHPAKRRQTRNNRKPSDNSKGKLKRGYKQSIMAAKHIFSAKNLYLIAYNTIQCICWSVILMGLGMEAFAQQSKGTGVFDEELFTSLYSRVELLLKVAQTAAILEIVHCIIKIVPSSPVLTGFQVFSRLFVLWMVTDLVPETQKSPGVVTYILCWTVTEIIRYSYYVLNIVGNVPYILLWCRYSFFFLLYPLGVTGELMTNYHSLPFIKKSGILSIQMPNFLNFSFSYYHFMLFFMMCYIPIFPQLFLHMIAQRKKFIGSKAKKTE